MKSADQLLLGFSKVEWRTVGLGENRHQQNEKRQRVQQDEPHPPIGDLAAQNALQADFTNGYNFAALVSLLILSCFSTIIFALLLVAQMMRALPHSLWMKLAKVLSVPPVTGMAGRSIGLPAAKRAEKFDDTYLLGLMQP